MAGGGSNTTQQHDEPDTSSRLRVRRLVVVRTPSPSHRPFGVVLEGEPRLLIGRAGHAPLPFAFADDAISRAHAAFEYVEASGAWRVVDQGSRNGTFVDGVRVEARELASGAVIRVGGILLLFQDFVFDGAARLEASLPDLLGPSIAMQRVRGEIAAVAPTDVPVLILGDSGAGKERIARAIHAQSGRRGPFVSVNAAAITENVAESELFGHVSGAFTGAARATEGLFSAAEGGTLFLDEIGELAAGIQAKLLRALATGEIRKVGATACTQVDVRVVAATNRDLAGAASRAEFRPDLFARLDAWRIEVPALRERRDDILPLASHFLAHAGGAAGLTADAAEALLIHAWPYNVRELENAMRVAAVRAGAAPLVGLCHLPPQIAKHVEHRRAGQARRSSTPLPLELRVPRDATPSRSDLEAALTHFGGNVARVAEYFGRGRTQVYRWASSLALDIPKLRE